LPLREEVCAPPDAQAQQFADAPLAQVKSGSAQAEQLPASSLPDGSVPDDCWAALAPDDYSAQSLPDECPVVSAPADSVALPDDLVEQEQPEPQRPAVQPQLAQCPADSWADSRMLPVGRAARHSARWPPDAPHSGSPVSPQARLSPWVEPPRKPPDAASAPRFSPMAVRDAPPTPAAVWRKAQAVEAASS